MVRARADAVAVTGSPIAHRRLYLSLAPELFIGCLFVSTRDCWSCLEKCWIYISPHFPPPPPSFALLGVSSNGSLNCRSLVALLHGRDRERMIANQTRM